MFPDGLPEGMDPSMFAGLGGGSQTIPAPPTGPNKPDTDPSEELGVGLMLKEDCEAEEKKKLTTCIFRSSFDPSQIIADPEREPSDAGLIEQFEQILTEIQGLSESEIAAFMLEYGTQMIVCVEMGMVTAKVIERAVACCLLYPSSLLYNNTGALFFAIRRYEIAIEYFRKAAEIDSESASVLMNIAECLFELGMYDDAMTYCGLVLRVEPEYGLAYQLMTTIHLKNGDSILAAETLFKSARTFFSDVSAAQFFSLNMALVEAVSQPDNMSGVDPLALLNEIFNTVNLACLAEATKAGFTTDGKDTIANQKTLAFPYEPGGLLHKRDALKKAMETSSETLIELTKKTSDLADDLHLGLYFAMGIQGYETDIAGMHISTISNAQYRMISQGYAGTADGTYLLDARQFWCLYTWQTYERILVDYYCGYYAAWDDQGGMHGHYPEEYATLYKELEAINDFYDREFKQFEDSAIALAMKYGDLINKAKSEAERLKLVYEFRVELLALVKNKLFAAETRRCEGEISARKSFYTLSVQPALEAYWQKMNAMAGYCDNKTVKEWFLTEALYTINERWLHDQYGDGYINAARLVNFVTSVINPLEEAVNQAFTEWEQAPPEPSKDYKNITLPVFGEKKPWNYGFGIPTPFGYVGLEIHDDQYTFVTKDKSGESVYRNLSTGEKTVVTSYQTLADAKVPEKSFSEKIGEFLTGKIEGSLIDSAGKLLGVSKASKFIPYASTESGRQYVRTIDSAGNTTDNAYVKFKNYSFGAGSIGAEATQITTRVGNVSRTENQVKFKFLFAQFSIGR